MIRPLIPLVGAVLPLCATIAHAHHSPAAFDISQTIVVDGTIAKLEWRNPHSYLVVETTSEDGRPLMKEVEFAGIATVQTTGLRRDHLAPGSHVLITGRPHRRDPVGKMIGMSVTLDDGSVHAMNPGADPSGIGFGVPSGAGKHLVERLALAADRRHIDYSFTLEDPEYLAEPVSFSSVWEHHPELSISSDAEPCDPEIAARFLEE